MSSSYTFEGPAWATSTITWSFAPAGGNFTNAITGAYQNTIIAAINAWAQVVNLTIQQVPTGTPGTDIQIGWGSFSGSQVGQTDYSYTGGSSETFLPGTQVMMEDPSLLPIGSGAGAYYQNTSTTLYELALHEFGHALGLGLSSDPTAVMHLTLGPSDNGLGASDIDAIHVLYGVPQSAVAQNGTQLSAPAPILPATINLGGNEMAVYRFFDTSNGTQFLTASAAERDQVISTRPDLNYEGLGMAGITPGSDPNAVPVYRFFDTQTGTHFFTASQPEESAIVATRPDLVLEQTTFYEHGTQQPGDVPVFRFFDSSNGTHFFTASAAEQTSLVATRPDMTFEGTAFYAPAPSIT